MLKKVYHLFKRKVNNNKLDAFYKQYDDFNKLNDGRFRLNKDDIFPYLDDNTTNTPFDAHYIYHPAWAARIIKETAPDVHIDISSTLHFCSILSAFVKTEFYDYRPASLTLSNLTCFQADLSNLHFCSNSVTSLSCMHTIEHIGLGRYGDPLDPEGDIKALNELKRVCAINGNLFIVVPVGIRRVQFNAHRIYAPADIVNYMDGFNLKNFALINDAGEFIESADMDYAAKQTYGCGCYWFKKLH